MKQTFITKGNSISINNSNKVGGQAGTQAPKPHAEFENFVIFQEMVCL